MGVTGAIPSAFPSEICGANGSDPDNCLRTVAPDVYYGNQDSQRIAPGSTLILECFVDGCGIGIGDVHGAQGDGEVSITAIEIEAKVKVSIKLIKPGDPMHVLPSPTTVGTSAIKDYSPTAFVSFHGFGNKPLPTPTFVDEAEFPWPIQQHITFGDAVKDMDFVADNLQLSGRNALLKCITFLHDVLGYSFSQVRAATLNQPTGSRRNRGRRQLPCCKLTTGVRECAWLRSASDRARPCWWLTHPFSRPARRCSHQPSRRHAALSSSTPLLSYLLSRFLTVFPRPPSGAHARLGRGRLARRAGG
jgi:hypothetical protein